MTFTLDHKDSVWSLILGPIVWALHFLFCYVLAAIFCAKGWNETHILGFGLVRVAVAIVTLIALAAIAVAGVVAWRRWREPGRNPLAPHDEDTVESRRQFMAYAAFLLCGLSFVGIVYDTLPALFIANCV